MLKAIFFVIGAAIGWAIMTQVPGVPVEVVYGVALAFGILPSDRDWETNCLQH